MTGKKSTSSRSVQIHLAVHDPKHTSSLPVNHIEWAVHVLIPLEEGNQHSDCRHTDIVATNVQATFLLTQEVVKGFRKLVTKAL